MRKSWQAAGWLAVGLALALAAGGCMTVREELQPVRETTLTTARSGDQITISWIGRKGMYYTVLYADSMSARSKWRALPDAVNIPGLVTGEPIVVHDRVRAGQQRVYRLLQDNRPLKP
ncbi:MAG: hypothetical protein GX803_01515 [Lentisphaerae bacterium]|nr:hypothetical protein [Lentisphaerota bacterium]